VFQNPHHGHKLAIRKRNPDPAIRLSTAPDPPFAITQEIKVTHFFFLSDSLKSFLKVHEIFFFKLGIRIRVKMVKFPNILARGSRSG
jgi:hypothetical protein